MENGARSVPCVDGPGLPEPFEEPFEFALEVNSNHYRVKLVYKNLRKRNCQTSNFFLGWGGNYKDACQYKSNS